MRFTTGAEWPSTAREEITVGCTQAIDGTTARALHKAPFLTLTTTLPIDRSTQSVTLTAEFFHVTGSEQRVPNEWDGCRNREHPGLSVLGKKYVVGRGDEGNSTQPHLLRVLGRMLPKMFKSS